MENFFIIKQKNSIFYMNLNYKNLLKFFVKLKFMILNKVIKNSLDYFDSNRSKISPFSAKIPPKTLELLRGG